MLFQPSFLTPWVRRLLLVAIGLVILDLAPTLGIHGALGTGVVLLILVPVLLFLDRESGGSPRDWIEATVRRRQEQRDHLQAKAPGDLHAARRLAKLLHQDLKGHELMRRRMLPGIPESERAKAAAYIDSREAETRAALEDVENTIRRLKS